MYMFNVGIIKVIIDSEGIYANASQQLDGP